MTARCGESVLPNCPLPAGHAGVHEECTHPDADEQEGYPDRRGRVLVWRVCPTCGAERVVGASSVL